MEIELSKIEQRKILPILSKAEIFNALPLDILETLLSRLKPIYLVGGEILINEGDEADCLYILANGRLRATKRTEQGEITIGEIGQGEAVGEIGVLLSAKRTATVRAVRDSLLLKFEKQTYDEFAELFPQAMLDIARCCIRRLLPETSKKTSGNNICTLAIIPAGSQHNLERFIKPFITAISKQKKILHLNRAVIYSALGIDVRLLTAESHKNAELVNWLQQQENEFEFVIYEADLELNTWTERCLRQADRIIAVAESQAQSGLNAIEGYLQQQELKIMTDLVLLQTAKPQNTALWLEYRQLYNHHHIINDSFNDYQRFIRYLTGNAIGLVLSGGGAQGLAYAGLLRALQELKIPVDYVGGTSIGAAMGGAIAQGLDYDEMIDAIQRALICYRKGFDYTLPIMSLLNARGVNEALGVFFAESLMIEDMHCNFFCVSTNLSEGKLQLHNRGATLKAVRASVSLPVIFPPVLSADSRLLVDGALINNMPVDLMRERINGGKILAVSLVDKATAPQYNLPADTLSGWRLLLSRLKPGASEANIPSIADIVTSSLKISSSHYQALMEKQATFCVRMDLNEYELLNFDAYQKISATGYQQAKPQLEKFLNILCGIEHR